MHENLIFNLKLESIKKMCRSEFSQAIIVCFSVGAFVEKRFVRSFDKSNKLQAYDTHDFRGSFMFTRSSSIINLIHH